MQRKWQDESRQSTETVVPASALSNLDFIQPLQAKYLNNSHCWEEKAYSVLGLPPKPTIDHFQDATHNKSLTPVYLVTGRLTESSSEMKWVQLFLSCPWIDSGILDCEVRIKTTTTGQTMLLSWCFSTPLSALHSVLLNTLS